MYISTNELTQLDLQFVHVYAYMYMYMYMMLKQNQWIESYHVYYSGESDSMTLKPLNITCGTHVIIVTVMLNTFVLLQQ